MSATDMWRSIPPVTKNLIIINFAIWAIEVSFPSFGQTLVRVLGLHYVGSSLFNPIQVITYLFIHDPSIIYHVFFNMFTLWMFGRMLERVWGSQRFLVFYMVCGIGAALVQEGVWAISWHHEYISAIAKLNGLTYESMKQVVDADPHYFAQGLSEMANSMVTIGASGAVFGLLLGFAFVFPNLPLYLFFIPVPIKAKYMVIGYGVLEFFFGVGGIQSSVAHFAHLGGMLFGLVILLYWKKKGRLGGGTFY